MASASRKETSAQRVARPKPYTEASDGCSSGGGGGERSRRSLVNAHGCTNSQLPSARGVTSTECHAMGRRSNGWSALYSASLSEKRSVSSACALSPSPRPSCSRSSAARIRRASRIDVWRDARSTSIPTATSLARTPAGRRRATAAAQHACASVPQFLVTNPIHEGPISRGLGHVSSALTCTLACGHADRRLAVTRSTRWCTRALSHCGGERGAAPACLRSAPPNPSRSLLSLPPWVRRLASAVDH